MSVGLINHIPINSLYLCLDKKLRVDIIICDGTDFLFPFIENNTVPHRRKGIVTQTLSFNLSSAHMMNDF